LPAADAQLVEGEGEGEEEEEEEEVCSTFPEEKRWHPFTVSKMKGLRSG